MGVEFDGIGICTDSHLDFFIRNLVICKGDPRLVDMMYGAVSDVRVAAASPAPDEPVTLQEAKDHLRIRHTEIDDQITAWIVAARQKVEHDTGVVLVPSTYRLTVHRFPLYGQALRLPIYPVNSVTSVDYYDSDGVLTAVASPLPYVLREGRPTFLSLDVGESWPSAVRTFDPGIIEVEAGYASPDVVPDGLKHAIKILTEQMHTHRGPVTTLSVNPVGIGYEEWIKPWQLPAL